MHREVDCAALDGWSAVRRPTIDRVRVFDDDDFLFTWPGALVGAACLSALFALTAMMGQLVSGGTFSVTRTVVGFGAAAFVGYLGVAALLRRAGRPSDGA